MGDNGREAHAFSGIKKRLVKDCMINWMESGYDRT